MTRATRGVRDAEVQNTDGGSVTVPDRVLLESASFDPDS